MKTASELAQDYAKAKRPKTEEHRRKLAEAQKKRWGLAKAAYEAQQQQKSEEAKQEE